MQPRQAIRYAIVISLLMASSLGCQLVSNLGRLKGTAEAVATEAQSGRKILGTGEAIATQVAGSGAVGTAQAFVTQGIPSLKETAQVMATEILATPSELPEDIPIMQGEKSAFVGSARAISYIVEKDFQVLLDYYLGEMPAKGWTKIDYGTVIADTQAELHYQMDHRSVIVVIAQIPFTDKSMVVITLEE